jgi:hypothetical protein
LRNTMSKTGAEAEREEKDDAKEQRQEGGKGA